MPQAALTGMAIMEYADGLRQVIEIRGFRGRASFDE